MKYKAAIIAVGSLGLMTAAACGTTVVVHDHSPAHQHAAAPPASTSQPPASSSTPQPTGPAQPSPGNPYSDQGFNDLSAIQTSVANEQASALNGNSNNSYYNVTVGVSCSYLRMNTYSCVGADNQGDVGSTDYVTVSNDGSSWSDTGMNWNGPNGAYNVYSVANWTAS